MQKRFATKAKRIKELEAGLKELRKKNPSQRLDDVYSVKAEKKRREDAQQGAKPKAKKQKSKRRGRISTAEKLAMATQEESICPAEYSLEECSFRYSRVAWRILNGHAVLVAYHISAGPDEAEKDFFNLTHEIVWLMSDDELFKFVIYPGTDGTNNNISERQLRAPAQDHVTGPRANLIAVLGVVR